MWTHANFFIALGAFLSLPCLSPLPQAKISDLPDDARSEGFAAPVVATSTAKPPAPTRRFFLFAFPYFTLPHTLGDAHPLSLSHKFLTVKGAGGVFLIS